MYMDRTYVTQNRKITIYDHGLMIFRDTIARHALVKDRLRHLLLQAVANERAGQLVERLLLKCVSEVNRCSVATLCIFCSMDLIVYMPMSTCH
jgi:cullin 3